jgi:tetratricopeptide (TPR) repeat protein
MLFSGKSRKIDMRESCQGGSEGVLVQFLKTRSSCLIAFLLFAGCAPRAVVVKVSDADALQANEAARDADVAFLRRDYYTALIKYLQSTRLNPNNDYVMNKLGVTYTQLRYYPEASDAFKRAIAIDPKFAHPYNNLGSIYFAQENYKMAERLFKKAISINPKGATFHLNLGRLYLEKRKKEKGVAELRKAVSLDPMVLERQGNITIAAVANRSSSSDTSYSMARIYGSIGDAARAVESLQQALNEGYTNIAAIEKEPDFDPIRSNELFMAFMKTASLMLKP